MSAIMQLSVVGEIDGPYVIHFIVGRNETVTQLKPCLESISPSSGNNLVTFITVLPKTINTSIQFRHDLIFKKL